MENTNGHVGTIACQLLYAWVERLHVPIVHEGTDEKTDEQVFPLSIAKAAKLKISISYTLITQAIEAVQILSGNVNPYDVSKYVLALFYKERSMCQKFKMVRFHTSTPRYENLIQKTM